MILELEFGSALCYTPVFVINGIRADSNDFGYQGDEDPDSAEESGGESHVSLLKYPTLGQTLRSQ